MNKSKMFKSKKNYNKINEYLFSRGTKFELDLSK